MSQKEKLIKKYTTYPLPVEVKFEEFIKYLEICGFHQTAVKGSHHMFFHKEYNLNVSIATMNGKNVKARYIEIVNELMKKREAKS